MNRLAFRCALTLFLSFIFFLGTAAAADLHPTEPLQNGPYATDGNITAELNSVVGPDKIVLFSAGGTISLKPGFHAQAGSTFRAVSGNYGGMDDTTDADGDKLADWWELTFFGNLDQDADDDPDGDSMTNIEEYCQEISSTLCNTNMVDDDNDGLADEWEIENFGNLDQGKDDDPDDDGFSNFVEYLIATDPEDGNEAPVPAGNYYDYDEFGRLISKRIVLEPQCDSGDCIDKACIDIDCGTDVCRSYGNWYCQDSNTRRRDRTCTDYGCAHGSCYEYSFTDYETDFCTTGCLDGSCVTYSWQSGPCSRPCEGGTREVYCASDNDGARVADSFCEAIKPSEVCNTQECAEVCYPYDGDYEFHQHCWSEDDNSCTWWLRFRGKRVDCGGGGPAPDVYNDGQYTYRKGELVVSGGRSKYWKVCTRRPDLDYDRQCPTYSWYIGDCDLACWNGDRDEDGNPIDVGKREVYCQTDTDGTPVEDRFCSGEKPDTVCNTQRCRVYHWYTSPCSAECGGGTREVYCQRESDGVQVPDKVCFGAKPSSSCNSQPCFSYSWYTGPCDAECGVGTRGVYCQRNDGTMVVDSYCQDQGLKPDSTCTNPQCPPVCYYDYLSGDDDYYFEELCRRTSTWPEWDGNWTCSWKLVYDDQIINRLPDVHGKAPELYYDGEYYYQKGALRYEKICDPPDDFSCAYERSRYEVCAGRP